MKTLSRLLLASNLTLAALPARPAPAQSQSQSQSQPTLRPTRDVVVTYQLDGDALNLVPGGLHGPVRLSWDAAGQRVRAEAEGRSQIALIDLRDHAGQAIDTRLRVSMPLPLRENALQPLTLEGARLTPHGKAVIAGLACTTYSFESPQGPGTICLTRDGVPLQGAGTVSGKPGSFRAIAVDYGALPPSLFQVPPGYMALPGLAPASQPGATGGLAGLAAKLGGAGALGNLGSLLGRGSSK